MSQLGHVIKEKGRIEKAERKRKEQEMNDVRRDTAYRAKLFEEMQAIRVMLQDPAVESIKIEVPEANIVQFMKAVYSDEMAEFNVTINGTTAEISRRMIQV